MVAQVSLFSRGPPLPQQTNLPGILQRMQITRYVDLIFFLHLVSPVAFLNFGYFCNAAKKITVISL